MRKPMNIRKEYFIYVANRPRQETIDSIGQKNIDKLRKILNYITLEGKIPESPEFEFFLSMAENYKQTTEKIFIHGKIHFTQIEEPYLTGLLTPKDHSMLQFELSRSLILFLGKQGNLKKIKECLMCKDFFIAKDVKRIICYKKICSNNYHKQDMKYRRNIMKKAIQAKSNN